MVTITVNGGAQDLADDTTLADLMTAVAGTTRGSAAVVDDEVVPRGDWATFRLRAGARVELITAVQGG